MVRSKVQRLVGVPVLVSLLGAIPSSTSLEARPKRPDLQQHTKQVERLGFVEKPRRRFSEYCDKDGVSLNQECLAALQERLTYFNQIEERCVACIEMYTWLYDTWPDIDNDDNDPWPCIDKNDYVCILDWCFKTYCTR